MSATIVAFSSRARRKDRREDRPALKALILVLREMEARGRLAAVVRRLQAINTIQRQDGAR